MAAGLGFKTFNTGDILSASDVNGYLMQGVLVFANATARDAAITSPQEGQFAYLKDTNVTTYYTGSAWANLDTTGMTNPMTTTGDTIYSSSGSTPARLGIGTTGQVLTVAGGLPTWATPAGGGGKVLQVVSATYSTSKTIASTTFTDTDLSLSITPTLNTSKVLVLISIHTRSNRNNIVNAGTIKLLRGSTDVWNGSASSRSFGSAGTNGAAELDIVTFMPITYLDSPATTSATTYKVQAKCDDTNQNGFVLFHGNTNESTITLMEIGA